MSEKMSNAPVYYALAQAQFNPVAAMSKYVDEIQDRLRHQNYTLYEAHQTTQLQFVANGTAPAEPKVAQTISWLLTKADRTSGFILGPSSIAFHTTHYETNREFISELLLGIQTVHDVVTLAHISRLGLRYLDAVLPLPGESVENYISESLHGIKLGAKLRSALNEAVFETTLDPPATKGTLVTRIHRIIASLGHPPDLLPHGLVQMQKFANTPPQSHAVIDTDHFVEGSFPLTPSTITKCLNSLHAVIKQAFEATTTAHARSTWA